LSCCATRSRSCAGRFGGQRFDQPTECSWQPRAVRSTFSFAIFEQLRAANTTLTDLAAGAPMGSLNVIVNGDAQLATGYEASGNYFKVVGVSAVLGRFFGEADDKPSAPPVAVISHPYWRKRFAGEPSVINRVVSINGQIVTVIGVTGPGFLGIQRLGSDPPDVTVPLSFDAVFSPPTPLPNARAAVPRISQPTYWWLQLVGRLKASASIEQARANFTTVFQNGEGGNGRVPVVADCRREESLVQPSARRRARAPGQVGRSRVLRT